LFPWIPSKSECASNISIRLRNAAAETWSHLIQQIAAAARESRSGDRGAGNRSQIRVRASGVAVVADAIDEGKIRLHLPVVPDINLEARVELPSAILAELRDFRKTTLPVAQADARYRIIQGI